MSITNAKLIEAALRDIGVLAETQGATPEQGAAGLERLNRLMEELSVLDIELGYFAQTSAAENCPIPAWAEKGVISKLAQALLLVYPNSTPVSPLIFKDDANGFGTIVSILTLQKLKPLDMRHLGGAAHNRWSVTTDEI